MNKELLVRHGTAFTLNPDSAPMFPGHAHQTTVDRLIAGLRLGRRLQYLSGAPGSGKSTVLLHFQKTVQSLTGVYIALVSAGDMVRRVLMELDLVVPGNLERRPDALFQELRVQMAAKGNPRLINLICNKALILVGLRDLPRVTPEVVDEVVRNRHARRTFPLARDIEVDAGRIAAAEDSHDRGNFRPSCSGPVRAGGLPAGADDTASEAPQDLTGTGTDPNAGNVIPTISGTVAGNRRHWRPGRLGFGLVTCATVIALLNSSGLDRLRSLWGESVHTFAQPAETGWNGAAGALALVQQETPNDAMVFEARGIDTAVLPEPPETQGTAAPTVAKAPAAGERRQAEPAATRKRTHEDTDLPQSPTTEPPAVSGGLSKHRQPQASAHQHRGEAGDSTGSRPDTDPVKASRESPGSDVAGSRDEAYAASEPAGVSRKPQDTEAADSRAEVSATTGTGMSDAGANLPPVIERGIQARPTDVPRLSSSEDALQ